MTAQLMQAIANRDGAAIARIAGNHPIQQNSAGVVNGEAERLVDALFRQLKQVFPAASATNLRTEADESAAKKQWIAAFAENGIRTREQLSAGMRKARSSSSPFWPSPGQFVAWCNSGVSVLGIGLDDVMAEFHRYNRDKGLYESAEAFPWQHPVLYWIVCDARRAMYQRCMGEPEVEQYAARKLSEWAKKVSEGEHIPNPVKTLPEPPEEPQRAHNATAADYQFQYMPNAAMLGSVTPAKWLMEEFRRRKSLGLVN